MKIRTLALTVACTLAAAATATGASAPIVGKALAVGTMKATTIHAGSGSMILESITVAPGGNFGWHTHGSPVAVIVTGGTLTVFDPTIGGCAPFKVSKGQSFVEPANHVHLARNDGTKPATLYAMFLGVSKAGAPTKPASQPAGCTA